MVILARATAKTSHGYFIQNGSQDNLQVTMSHYDWLTWRYYQLTLFVKSLCQPLVLHVWLTSVDYQGMTWLVCLASEVKWLIWRFSITMDLQVWYMLDWTNTKYDMQSWALHNMLLVVYQKDFSKYFSTIALHWEMNSHDGCFHGLILGVSCLW